MNECIFLAAFYYVDFHVYSFSYQLSLYASFWQFNYTVASVNHSGQHKTSVQLFIMTDIIDFARLIFVIYNYEKT